jgi:hypothetical protein
VCVCIHVYLCMHACMHVFVQICSIRELSVLHTFMQRLHTHTQTHTHTHTNTHTKQNTHTGMRLGVARIVAQVYSRGQDTVKQCLQAHFLEDLGTIVSHKNLEYMLQTLEEKGTPQDLGGILCAHALTFEKEGASEEAKLREDAVRGIFEAPMLVDLGE